MMKSPEKLDTKPLVKWLNLQAEAYEVRVTRVFDTVEADKLVSVVKILRRAAEDIEKL